MQARRCSIDDLDFVLEREILEPFAAETSAAVAKGVDDTARQMVKETKSTAPRSKLDRSGTFASSIAWKGEDTGHGSHRATWYVRSPEHRLTHLLVHGHATPNGGRTRGNDFLKNALDNAEVKLLANIQEDGSMKRVEEALEAAGVKHTFTSWAPLRPPAPPYAVLVHEVETLGADGFVMAYAHSLSIELYTDGKGEEVCRKVAGELARRGIAFQQNAAIYLYDLKQFETVFDIEDDFYEKVSGMYGDDNEEND